MNISKMLDDDNITPEEIIEALMPKSVNHTIEKYYIAYIDFLGMKIKMQTYSDDDFCAVANQIATLVESIISGNASNEEAGLKHIDFHMFSDNMIFLCKDFYTLLDFIALLQRRIIIQLQMVIKGGLDYGSIYYYKNRFLLGNGLASAYDIDEKYPHPAIKIGSNISKKYFIDNKSIRKISDDEFIVDYLYHSSLYDIYDFYTEMELHKEFLISNLNDFKNGPDKIFSKYKWLQWYHNMICEEMECKKNIIDEAY